MGLSIRPPNILVQQPQQHLADRHAVWWPLIRPPGHRSQPPLDPHFAPEPHTSLQLSITVAAQSWSQTMNPNKFSDLPDLPICTDKPKMYFYMVVQTYSEISPLEECFSFPFFPPSGQIVNFGYLRLSHNLTHLK